MSDEKQRRRRMSRRTIVRRAPLAIAGATLGAGSVDGQQSPAGNPVTPDDVAVVAAAIGREFGPAERQQMARRLTNTRAVLRAIRSAPLSERDSPALQFDPVLPGTRLPEGKSRIRMSRGALPAYEGRPESLAFASVVELARLIRARKVTATELTRMYLARLKRYGPRLQCVVTLTEELALSQAARADREIAAGKYRGPLHGIPWGAKDILATRGIPTTWGARPYEHQVFDYDATVVARLEAAGAVLVAKLTTGELALGDVWFGGVTRNPWRPERGSSGSSAGPGSATAAGLVGFAIGSETLGSIVSPSIVNGVTGLRPTFGRVPRTGAMTLCWSMDKIGPMCRAVEDCALVLATIQGPDGRDTTIRDVPFVWDPGAPLSSLRVGVDRAAFRAIGNDAALKRIYDDVLAVLEKLGLSLRPIDLPARNAAFDALAGFTIMVESATSFTRLMESGQLALLARQGDNAWPNTFRVGSVVPAADYLNAQRIRRHLMEAMARVFDEVDLYVTIPGVGPSLSYTNLTGHPTVVTRCGEHDGLPRMIEFTGGLFREAEILRVALAYERATPWHRRWPDVDQLPETPPPLRTRE